MWHASGIAEALTTEMELKKEEVTRILVCLAAVATKRVRVTGKVTFPGLVAVRTLWKPVAKTGKRDMFSEVIVLETGLAEPIVKTFCVAALTKSVWVEASVSQIRPWAAALCPALRRPTNSG